MNIFKYWFRCVRRNMKFINNVHLVVSNIEQVPSWLNTSKVNVVLHKDIIPENYLPTFNSTTIEMFLCRIPGLSERFIYSNDDMFAINECSPDDFFNADGFPRYMMHKKKFPKNIFQFQCFNSYNLARKTSGWSGDIEDCAYIRPVHGFTPLLRSVCEELWDKAGNEI